MIKQALILAAGKGTRMLDLTAYQAKPMIEVCGRSLLHRIMDQLVEYGVEKIVVNTFYEAEKLEDHIRSYDKFGDVTIETVREQELLETGGGIINMLPHIKKEPFFVVNGDSLLVGENVFEFLNSNWSNAMSALLLLFDPHHAIGYRGKGDFSVDSKDKIILHTDDMNKLVFSGVHVATHGNFSGLPANPIRLFDIYRKNSYNNMYGLVFDKASFLHVGDKNAVEEAERYLLNMSV